MWCATCGAPVYESSGAWFHDVWPRWLATVCRDVSEHPLVTAAKTVSLPELARLP